MNIKNLLNKTSTYIYGLEYRDLVISERRNVYNTIKFIYQYFKKEEVTEDTGLQMYLKTKAAAYISLELSSVLSTSFYGMGNVKQELLKEIFKSLKNDKRNLL